MGRQEKLEKLRRKQYLTKGLEVARLGAPAKWYVRCNGEVIAGPFTTKGEALTHI